MTGRAPVGLDRSMLINKRALLVRMTLNASCIRTSRESCLFQFKPAMRVVTIAALHGSFENLVMEWQIKLVFHFRVTAHAELWLARFQQPLRREPRFLSVGFGDEYI